MRCKVKISYSDKGKIISKLYSNGAMVTLEWGNTIEEILTKYDKENGGSNSKTLQKLSQKDERNPTIQEIKRILSLKYEEIIREYSNSEQFDKDVKSFNDEDDRNSFFELGQGYPANFISIMKNIKGNVKKNYNGTQFVTSDVLYYINI